MSVPLLDSLSHPTLSGTWQGRDATFQQVADAAAQNGFSAACAVGIAGKEGYEHAAFMRQASQHERLIPVAGLDPGVSDLAGELEPIADLGSPAVKIHPRFSGYQPEASSLGALFEAVHAHGLVTFYCTYVHASIPDYPDGDPLYTLVGALKRAPEARVVLLHGGDVRLMQYAQLVRHNPNLLLDLSFTALKYPGSSLQLDIAYLVRHLDQRLCVGVDHPDFTHAELRNWFEGVTADLAVDKAHNIGHRNLERMLGLPNGAPP